MDSKDCYCFAYLFGDTYFPTLLFGLNPVELVSSILLWRDICEFLPPSCSVVINLAYSSLLFLSFSILS